MLSASEWHFLLQFSVASRHNTVSRKPASRRPRSLWSRANAESPGRDTDGRTDRRLALATRAEPVRDPPVRVGSPGVHADARAPLSLSESPGRLDRFARSEGPRADARFLARRDVLNLCIGLCTPPVGTVLFVGCGVADAPIGTVIRPLLPLFLAMLAVLAAVTAVPGLSLWLPRLFGFV